VLPQRSYSLHELTMVINKLETLSAGC